MGTSQEIRADSNPPLQKNCVMLLFIAYNLILLSVSPVILGWGLWRLAKGKSRLGLTQRLGFLRGAVARAERKRTTGGQRAPRIWVHACSAGEVSAVRPVIRILRERLPEALIFISTITPTGQTQARRFCPEADAVFCFPFDFLPCIWQAMRALRPDLCVLSEKELWPNFLALCWMKKIPVVVVNGTLSDRAESRTRWFGGFMRWLMGMVTFFSVQTERDRARLLSLGVNADRVGVDGNTKFDQPAPPPGKEEALARALGWEAETPWLVAGSTHAGEDGVVLEAFKRLKKRHPRACLLLAPRHPERAAAVAALVERYRLPWVRRSALEGSPAKKFHGVVILDTIGELTLAYRLGRAAFVGGSLAPHVGGHNPLEAVAEGRPVFFGPHMQNVRDLAALLCEEKVAQTVKNAGELAAGWQRALEDEGWRAKMEQRAAEIFRRHRGGSERAAQRALKLLAERGEKREEKSDSIPPPALRQPLAPASRLTRGREYLLSVIENGRKGFLPGLIRFGLEGISYGYRAGLAVNLGLYDVRVLSRRRLSCPVIGVGNITLGGTGKTLATLTICEWLLKREIRPAVLSRGYGGNSSSPRLVFDGERLRLGPKEAGDEPFLLAASLPEARVLVGKDRRRSAEMALRLGAQVMVLDDGFQYWKLEKDFELVLVDALNPFGNGHLFPRGLLREPPASLRRAQAIWITHSDLVPREGLAALRETLGNLAPEAPIAETMHHPVALRDLVSGDRIGLWTLEGKRLLALSGLGNPLSFELLLQRLGAEVIPARFPDHHRYKEDEIASLTKACGNASMIVTTAKDAVRLPRQLKTDLPLRVLEVRLARFSRAGEAGMGELLEEIFSWLTSAG